VSYRKNGLSAVWALLANMLYALTQWLLLIVVARLSDPFTLGTFSLVLAVASPVFMATNMRLRFVQSADYAGKWRLADYLRVRTSSAILATLLCALISLFWWNDRVVMMVLWSVSIAKALEALQDTCIGSYQQRSRMELAVVSNLVTGGLSILAFAIAFSLTRSLSWACLALALGRLGGLVFLDLPLSKRIVASGESLSSSAGQVPSQLQNWRSLVLLAWPLGVVAALDSLNAGLPRYFLSWAVGNAEVGVFAAMVHLSFAGFVLVNAVGQSMAPRMARQYGKGERREFIRSATQLLGFAVLVGTAGILAASLSGDLVLRLIYGSEFVTRGRDFVLVMTAGALSYLGLSAVFLLSAAQILRVQVWLYAANTIGGIVCGLLLVPVWGIAGAAIAQVVANLLQAAVSYAFLKRSLFRSP
jgi:O-antigen/teichoic acid export membrane protein